MFTDNKDFYPTPEHLIRKMLSGIDFNYINSILEPSAGKGNIIDKLKEIEKPAYSYSSKKYNFDIDCIEPDQNLRSILKDKNYRLVYNDFLTYNTMKEYDLIVMNPPFSNGCKHLLKALEMQERNGGAIVCILNAETLKNDYTNDRKLLNRKLKEYNATIEYMQESFIGAERSTSVEVALIKVKLPEVKRDSFILEGLRKTQEQREFEETEQTAIVEGDFFKAIINQYQLEVEAGINLIKEFKAMSPYIMTEFKKDEETGETVQTGGCILRLDLESNRGSYNSNLSINGYIKDVRRKYWKALFNNQEFIGKLTNNLQREFYNRLEDLSNYDFSLYNIYELKVDMSNNVVKGIEDTIISLFDELSHKHYWDKDSSSNIHYYNGWKTNKSYIINKKVIIPLSAYSSYSDYYRPSLNTLSKLQDIEKCFNYLDGGLTDAVDLRESLNFAEEFGETKNIQLKYFTVTFYKKGTTHITFNDDELLKKFNIFGSQKKGWLPPSYGKKAYKDMTSEEKAVVNEFEGEKEYNKVMTNTKYYLFDGSNMNLLEDKSA
ncbi:DUF4942 domain-containing protein [Anaerocolumna aminovalerica]|uniref:DUF4942 domain-containing protein n=1 Tax=Anaerocolumna aminovalerica TaxID=1527 RepID=UPI001C0F366E|nr:DUF4942 domain-containing protein [Anaerocolumna aminovalerica]MBU5333619.1 DUF4942 domain-containing protein [Anaerocolumna aminovalerica]